MSIDIDPDVGTLVYLHHFSSDLDGLFVANGKTEIFVENETIALVVGHCKVDGQKPVPIVLVNGFCGWVFRDEWRFVQSTC